MLLRCRNPRGRRATLTAAVAIDSPAHATPADSRPLPPVDVMGIPCQPPSETDIRNSTESLRG
jgi:hypothetical protein